MGAREREKGLQSREGEEKAKNGRFSLGVEVEWGGETLGRRTGGGEFSVYKQWDVRGAVQLGFEGAIRYCQAWKKGAFAGNHTGLGSSFLSFLLEQLIGIAEAKVSEYHRPQVGSRNQV